MIRTSLKKVIAGTALTMLVMTPVLIANTGVFVFATENQTISKGGEPESTEIKATISSNYSVKIPKVITLNSESKSETYEVSVTGDIAGTEAIKVTPPSSVTLEQPSKNSITATIEQPYTTFRSKDYTGSLGKSELKISYTEEAAKATGTITATSATAGTWSGKFNFTITKSTSIMLSVVSKTDSTDLNATASLIEGEQAETLIDLLSKTGYIKSTEKVDELVYVDTDNFSDIAEATFDLTGIAEPDDTVMILHYNEETQAWEYITTATVDANNQVKANFTSFSPVAFVKVNSDGEYTDLTCKSHTFESSHECKVCGHTVSDHNYVNGTCTICGQTCEHSYDKEESTEENHTCSICGITGEHNYSNGTCKKCGYEHKNHEYTSSEYCSICHKKCTHESVEQYEVLYDGMAAEYYIYHKCSTCGTDLRHSFQYDYSTYYAKCTDCDFVCKHTYGLTNLYDGEHVDTLYHDCIACYWRVGAHTYKDVMTGENTGVCSECFYVCNHESSLTYNYHIDDKSYDSKYYHFCVECEFNMGEHTFENGTCTECYYTCKHTDDNNESTWVDTGSSTSQCSICKLTK